MNIDTWITAIFGVLIIGACFSESWRRIHCSNTFFDDTNKFFVTSCWRHLKNDYLRSIRLIAIGATFSERDAIARRASNNPTFRIWRVNIQDATWKQLLWSYCLS